MSIIHWSKLQEVEDLQLLTASDQWKMNTFGLLVEHNKQSKGISLGSGKLWLARCFFLPICMGYKAAAITQRPILVII